MQVIFIHKHDFNSRHLYNGRFAGKLKIKFLF